MVRYSPDTCFLNLPQPQLMEASDEIEDNKDTLQMLRSEIGSKEKLITGLKNIIDEQTEEFEELCTKCERLGISEASSSPHCY